MSVMQWEPSFVLNNGTMDATHHEFVELVNRLGDAPDDQVLGVTDEFIRHTEAHFSQEQAWMDDIEFAPRHCHAREHDGVLEVAREVRNRIANGEPRFGKVLAKALAEWFAMHATSMDAVLAMYLQELANSPDQRPAFQAACGDPGEQAAHGHACGEAAKV